MGCFLKSLHYVGRQKRLKKGLHSKDKEACVGGGGIYSLPVTKYFIGEGEGTASGHRFYVPRLIQDWRALGGN